MEIRPLLLLASLFVSACHAESSNDLASGSAPSIESASFSVNEHVFSTLDIRRCNNEDGALDLFIKAEAGPWLIIDTDKRERSGALNLRLHGKYMREQFGATTFYHHPDLSYVIEDGRIHGTATVASTTNAEKAKNISLVFNLPIPTVHLPCPKH